MKILILSCSTGEGHNSAAKAVEEALLSHGVECVIKDPVSFKSEKTEKLVASLYNNMIKIAPTAFGAIYKVGEWYDSTGMKSPVYLANSSYAGELFDYIEKNGFDAVIATHLYGMEALTAIRKKLGKQVRSYGVMTDYAITPFFCDIDLDGYFAPCDEIGKELVQKGFPEDRIYTTGIPVSARFNFDMSRDEARGELGIPLDKKVFIVMSGGIGGGNVIGLCDELVKTADPDTLIYVLTGKNTKRRAKIEARYRDNKNITAVPFTRQVNIYMRAADVMLSKPGGLSSTEAAVAAVPLIHINTIPGCESENEKFFSSHGMSLMASDTAEAAELAAELAADKERSEKMREAQRRIINPRAAENIVEVVTKS